MKDKAFIKNLLIVSKWYNYLLAHPAFWQYLPLDEFIRREAQLEKDKNEDSDDTSTSTTEDQ